MITTFTANPSLDKTVTLGAPLAPGHVQIAVSTREDAGGKGINVARVVAAAGGESVAVLPLADGDPYAGALDAAHVDVRPVRIDGVARSNITLVDPEGITTKVNLPGAFLSSIDVDALVSAVVDASSNAHWLVLAGSLPPGAPESFYADVIIAVRERHGAEAPRVAVDASGAALRNVVGVARPDLIKPNHEELAELVGASLAPDGSDRAATALAHAARCVPDKAAAALVTLGSQGALLVTAEGAWVGTAPRITVASTVGAGDSALAGYLLAHDDGADAEGSLRRSIQYGSAAASLPGTQAPRPEDLPTTGIETHRVN
ncbi:1-phosphofructokinase family hexose kinase [Paramicrobacterium fandaimingii]|uniref:1-phosphofructokinase family hexose kinase n=1 Tax=Paramicrobacterium fandaimingii TaxID=2708079 RepID=UPI00141E1053|nr:1-phosphofructokinase family hexose kinase [Microbacterium fandaimingii]